MRAPTSFYDQRFLEVILFIIISIVLSLAITNGITSIFRGFGCSDSLRWLPYS